MTPVLAATASENAELIVFIILAPLAVVTALGMVLSRNAVYSALLLVVDINLPRPVLLGAIGVLLVLLLLSFLLPSSEKGKADRTAPGGSTS